MSEDLEAVQRNPVPTVLGLVCGLLAGFLIGWVLFREAEAVSPVTPTAATPAAEIPTAIPTSTAQAATGLDTGALAGALDAGVAAAKQVGGTAQAAIAVDDGPAILVGDDPGGQIAAGTMLRLATAVAGAEQVAPDVISRSLADPTGCWDRAVVAELANPATTVGKLFRQAGLGPAAVTGSKQATPKACAQQLAGEVPEPTSIALDGSRWTIGTAVTLIQALDRGRLGDDGEAVLQRLPDATTDWGATKVLQAFEPAVLTGWGGTADEPLTVGELAVLEVGGQKVFVAAAVHPAGAQTRDVKEARAPAALDALWAPLAEQLRQLEGDG